VVAGAHAPRDAVGTVVLLGVIASAIRAISAIRAVAAI
jgi:hypothetical protein